MTREQILKLIGKWYEEYLDGLENHFDPDAYKDFSKADILVDFLVGMAIIEDDEIDQEYLKNQIIKNIS